MKFYKKCEAWGLWLKEKICYVLKTKKKKKKKKKRKDLVASGFEPRTPAWESNITSTAPANYVFKIESSFYIVTYSSS